MVYSVTGVGNHAGRAGSRRALSTEKPAPTIDDSVSPMGMAVAHQPRPHRGVDDLLQPSPDARAGDVLDEPQFTTGAQQRMQLPQNAVRVVDRTEHQRAHHGVERLPAGVVHVLLDGARRHRHRNRRLSRGVASQWLQPPFGFDGEDLGHRVRIEREVRPCPGADFQHAPGQACEVFGPQPLHLVGFVAGQERPESSEERIVSGIGGLGHDFLSGGWRFSSQSTVC